MKTLLWFGAAVLLLSGCATTSMKGTPFYTGEYEVREGPAADRVNLWPLLYYRDPALSVLWPVMESSPDHLAVRPVYSVYGRETDTPVHNVLWPIGRFDSKNRDYRIFPVYWGDEYFNVAPLYWHEGDPFSGIGHNALFPLWIWNRAEDGQGLDLCWPIYANRKYADQELLRVGPLYGKTLTDDRHYRYMAWPFFHSYTNAQQAGHTLLPIYWQDQSDDRSLFLSLPYSRSLAKRPEARSWDLALPLWYRSWEGESAYWGSFPLLSWGWREPQKTNSWYALGLGRRFDSPEKTSHHVLPLYYYGDNGQTRSIYTLPWWSIKSHDGTGAHALIPLYYRSRLPEVSAFYSLPLWSRRYADGSGWNTAPPFYYRGYADDASVFYSLPWFSEKRPDGSGWQASFPFYYSSSSTNGSVMITPLYARKQQSDGSTAWQCIIPLLYLDETKDAHFLTPLGGRWRMGDEQHWLALPLLSGGARNADSGYRIWLAGLAGQRWDSTEKSHYVLPFYYAAPYADTFASLPYTTWSSGDRQTRLLPLLLSGWYKEEQRSGSLLFGGLAGHRSGSDRDYHYAVPFYYAAPDRGLFLSLPYAAWKYEGGDYHAIPPLLSGWYTEGDASGSFFAAGLAGHRTGDEDAYHYVFPFYYSAPQKGSFLSIPYAAWRAGDRQNHSIPLLLSRWSQEGALSESLWFGGLASWNKRAGKTEASHVLPLYFWSKDHYFYTAWFGHNREMSYYATPLAGRYTDAGGSGSWMFPLYRHRRKASGDVDGRYLLLGYYRENALRRGYGVWGLFDHNRWKSFTGTGEGRQLQREGKNVNYCFFLGENRERWVYADGGSEPIKHTKEQYFFPLWQRSLNEKPGSGDRLETSSVLGFLYDTRHEQESGERDHDYLRRRVLWRLFHYEKLNGDASADIFPGITIDAYKNGYRKSTFLWRLFRYEKNPDTGRTQLDLLFIPLRR